MFTLNILNYLEINSKKLVLKVLSRQADIKCYSHSYDFGVHHPLAFYRILGRCYKHGALSLQYVLVRMMSV